MARIPSLAGYQDETKTASAFVFPARRRLDLGTDRVQLRAQVVVVFVRDLLDAIWVVVERRKLQRLVNYRQRGDGIVRELAIGHDQ